MHVCLNSYMDETTAEYQKVMAYVEAHPAAVVSAVNDDGTPHSAVVYVFPISHHTVCFVTRNLTRKYQNIFERPAVSLTIYDRHDLSTLQASGTAFIANDEHMLSYTLGKIDKMMEIRGDSISPIGKMQSSGDYVLVGIELSKATLTMYQGIDVNIDKPYEQITIG